ncbi:MAG: hypothetical protein JOY56_15735, partial [Solirubrobacterales bacterium]|nr:hypothetical protein [Solirubrobacterales bacterium]
SPGFTFEVARFLPDGQLDPSFGQGGVAQATPPQNNGVAPTVVSDAIGLGPGGQILVAGHLPSPSGSDEFGVARFTSAGTPDQSFGQGGVVATQILPPGQSSVFEPASAVLAQSDGTILVGGSALVGGYRGSRSVGAVVVTCATEAWIWASGVVGSSPRAPFPRSRAWDWTPRVMSSCFRSSGS